jgi:hypothetical protein
MCNSLLPNFQFLATSSRSAVVTEVEDGSPLKDKPIPSMPSLEDLDSLDFVEGSEKDVDGVEVTPERVRAASTHELDTNLITGVVIPDSAGLTEVSIVNY